MKADKKESSSSSLQCVVCGGVYQDRWSAKESPVCPYCGYSHYEETEKALRGAARRVGVAFPTAVEKLNEEWARYQKTRQILDRFAPQADEMIVHRKALRGNQTGVGTHALVRDVTVDSLRRDRHLTNWPTKRWDEDGFVRVIPTDPDDMIDEQECTDIEGAVLLRELWAELEAEWQRGATHGLTFRQALEMVEIRTDREVLAIKRRVSRVLHKYRQKMSEIGAE